MPSADVPDPDLALPRMTLAEHLDELRARVLRAGLALIVAMVVAFAFWGPIWDFVRQPYLDAAAAFRDRIPDPKLMSVDPGEGFLSTLKLAFLAAVVVAAPVIIWQLWGFVAAGLYAHERRWVRLFFPISVVLFLLGMVFAYTVLMPFGFRFLISWNLDMGLTTDFRVQTYLSTCLTIVFGMSLLFELPLVMLFLQATNMVQRKTFAKHWRWAVLLSFVVAMFLTDPSPVTQVLMALPVVLLYFLGIFYGRFVGEDRVPIRWYHVWPILFAAALVTLLVVFADEINNALFGVAPPGGAEGAADPGGAGPATPETPPGD